MHEDSVKDTGFESNFDVNKVSFENVSREFENKFRDRYRRSLEMMSGKGDRLESASGANSLGVLEKMARQINDYDRNSKFEESYGAILREFEPFTET